MIVYDITDDGKTAVDRDGSVLATVPERPDWADALDQEVGETAYDGRFDESGEDYAITWSVRILDWPWDGAEWRFTLDSYGTLDLEAEEALWTVQCDETDIVRELRRIVDAIGAYRATGNGYRIELVGA